MPKQRNSAHRRSRRRSTPREPRTGFWGRLLIMLAIVAAVVLGVAIFFRVQVIDVQGNQIYSAEQIREICGVEPGDNLLMVNRHAISGNIRVRMPYVKKSSVNLILPDTVVIQVEESQIAGLVAADTGASSSWYVDTEGRVLGGSLEGFTGQIVELRGFTLTAPKAGESAVAAEGKEENMHAALEVLGKMEGTGLLEQVTVIDAEKSFDLILEIGDRLEVLLGSTEDLDYKLQYLQVILESLEDYQAGTIDLTFDVEQVARFIARKE